MVDTTWGTGAPLDDPGDIVSTAEALRTQARELLAMRASATAAVRTAADGATAQTVAAQLAAMPLDALKDSADRGRLRLGALEDAGITTVGQVRGKGRVGLELIPGVGPKTSMQVIAAAERVEAAVRAATRIRFDVDDRAPEQTTLLRALRHLELVERFVEPLAPRLDAIADAVDIDLDAARLETRRIRRFFASGRRKSEATAALARLNELLLSPDTSMLVGELSRARSELAAAAPAGAPVDVWADYLARPVAYNGLLAEVAGLAPDAAASHGLLPADIVDRIEAFELDTSLLNVSLRGYQAFGAKFALVQQRVILGDDMGLGKTIEALAVLGHLRANGARHFLVVCPASVLANWANEIARHTTLDAAWRLHGDDRDATVAAWAAQGGTAITTFDTLRALTLPDVALDAVVVDEAHFVKNPGALRTKSVRAVVARSSHVLLMSGTPMENRVEEFKVLVDHIRPDVAATIHASSGAAGADAFRRAVAPVYLRRNQTDVLDELPPRIESAEWLTLDGPALATYRAAVADENFMAMRRAAFLTEPPERSPKLERLLEIVAEAVENERKVVVFSFFLDVISRVHAAVGELAVGPLTGSVPAPQRQLLVDEFTARPGPAVLVAQIEAGGVGLNIQAASVVVLTEPQWKPTTEEQAIARCHRMGQVRPVEVHRLLTEDSVDERMVEILATKSALFADYVRKSAMRDASPDAVDASTPAPAVEPDTTPVDAAPADVVPAAEPDETATQSQQERQIIAAEKERLGLPAAS